jgi:hypothetical protein
MPKEFTIPYLSMHTVKERRINPQEVCNIHTKTEKEDHETMYYVIFG